MRESAIERRLVTEAIKRGGFAPKFVSPGLDGVPDRLLQSPQLKSGSKGIIKGRDSGKDFSQKALQPSPEMFNRIEFRGVGWKKEKSTPGILGSKK